MAVANIARLRDRACAECFVKFRCQRWVRIGKPRRRRPDLHASCGAVARHPHRQETCSAFLQKAALAGSNQPRFDGNERAADTGVPRERKFTARSENAYPVIRVSARRRKQEGGFGKVGPSRKLLHRMVVEAVGVHDHRRRVAQKRFGSEYVNHGVTSGHGSYLRAAECR